MAEPSTPEEIQWRVSGIPRPMFRDLFPRLMAAPWTVTIAWAFAAYVGASVVFAGLYALEPGGVNGASSPTELLWFSVQTLSTIGYGGMTPKTPFANLLVILESFIGLAGVAVVTALLYAKFSLPDARVRFSSVLAVHDYRGQPTLHFRMANERTSPILDAELHVGVLIDESDDEVYMVRQYNVPLARHRIPFFVMAFTAMHTLDEDSPLRGLDDPESLRMLIVTVRGVDGRTLQPVFTRAGYTREQVRFGMAFDDMIHPGPDGTPHVDLSRIDALVPRPLGDLLAKG